MWWQRLQAGQRIVEDWQRIIQVHTLVLSPREDMYTWLKYASLCRKNGSLVFTNVHNKLHPRTRRLRIPVHIFLASRYPMKKFPRSKVPGDKFPGNQIPASLKVNSI